MRKNMKIPRKKEKSEQPIEPIIIPRIMRLTTCFEPTISSQTEGMEGSCNEEQCM
jgi:hypothetical protein